MTGKPEILHKRLDNLARHYAALQEYHGLIIELERQKDIYTPAVFDTLGGRERALLDAYLKRYSSLQDYMGAKVFPLLLESVGIAAGKMSEVLATVEREGIIDSLQAWIELREIRNDLEHDYPDDLARALSTLHTCVSSFSRLERYYQNVIEFSRRYGITTIG
uniref:Nucleotidyltransferase substrate binding protein, HI0074 family n=1 Tax=Candidatus Kentrum sp. FM TaxID=2126340 RepID=A0A450SW74_9GAMM|nr:MAG: hypothetical protein BECKFM1743C_GA0114222_101679 [Candidatus Kentron sp. FM]VFJ58286.1 MAG: hypothetical protein BECKFM1743A_GA0114220_102113 [Candidatus Kentron sp. FM]VFK11614.1 MAG: hypothetical protein BECKFM1743B_GA0114221_101984 [Candidatus Kentron sp. FM]